MPFTHYQRKEAMPQIKKIGQWFLVSPTQSPARLLVGNLFGVILLFPWLAAVVLRDSPFLQDMILVMGMGSTRGALSLAGVILINMSVLIQKPILLDSRVYLTRSLDVDSMKEVGTVTLLAVILYKITFTISILVVTVMFTSIVLDLLA